MTGTLEVRSLRKRFGHTQALDDVGVVARPGEVLGVIGPNGSGKSTLLLCVAGLAEADSGETRWNGARLEARDLKNVLICIEDGIKPWEEQRVGWLLEFWTRLHKRSLSEIPAVADGFGVTELRGKQVKVLSKGQRKRVILALGLLAAQPVVLYDEPFDGLDLRQAQAASDVLRAACASGRTVVVSMHQLDQATRVCDRLVLLDNGRVAGAGSMSELRAAAGVPDGSLEAVFLALT